MSKVMKAIAESKNKKIKQNKKKIRQKKKKGTVQLYLKKWKLINFAMHFR